MVAAGGGGTAWWLIVLPAFTGLAGALIVAAYQGRASRQAWKNDARLRAYSEFIERVFEFDRTFDDLFNAVEDEILKRGGYSQLIPEFIALEKAVNRIALARAAVIVVGPQSLFEALDTILDQCLRAFDRVRLEETSIMGDIPEREEFTGSLHDFAAQTQLVLGTKG
jgi:hypothetical protein